MFNIYRMLLLALKKVRIATHSSSGTCHPIKKSPQLGGNFPPLNATWKTLMSVCLLKMMKTAPPTSCWLLPQSPTPGAPPMGGSACLPHPQPPRCLWEILEPKDFPNSFDVIKLRKKQVSFPHKCFIEGLF